MADVCNVQGYSHTHALTSNQIDMVETKDGSLFVYAFTLPLPAFACSHAFTLAATLFHMHFSNNSVNMKSSMNMRGDLLVFNITMHTPKTLKVKHIISSAYALIILCMQHKTSCCDETISAKQESSAVEIRVLLISIGATKQQHQ